MKKFNNLKCVIDAEVSREDWERWLAVTIETDIGFSRALWWANSLGCMYVEIHL